MSQCLNFPQYRGLRHQSEIHISFAQATDRELGTDWQQLHADQELGRHLRADRHGDAGRAGLVPRPAGDDPDPPVRLRHGLQQGKPDDLTMNDIGWNRHRHI